MYFPSLLPIILEISSSVPTESAGKQHKRFTYQEQNLKDTLRSTIAAYGHMGLFVVTSNR